MDGNCRAKGTLRIAHSACSTSTSQNRVEHPLEKEHLTSVKSQQTTKFERDYNSKQENSLSSNVLIRAEGHNFTFEAKMNMTKHSRNTGLYNPSVHQFCIIFISLSLSFSGLYNPSAYHRLQTLCRDCYNLFREPEVCLSSYEIFGVGQQKKYFYSLSFILRSSQCARPNVSVLHFSLLALKHC